MTLYTNLSALKFMKSSDACMQGQYLRMEVTELCKFPKKRRHNLTEVYYGNGLQGGHMIAKINHQVRACKARDNA